MPIHLLIHQIRIPPIQEEVATLVIILLTLQVDHLLAATILEATQDQVVAVVVLERRDLLVVAVLVVLQEDVNIF